MDILVIQSKDKGIILSTNTPYPLIMVSAREILNAEKLFRI